MGGISRRATEIRWLGAHGSIAAAASTPCLAHLDLDIGFGALRRRYGGERGVGTSGAYVNPGNLSGYFIVVRSYSRESGSWTLNL